MEPYIADSIEASAESGAAVGRRQVHSEACSLDKVLYAEQESKLVEGGNLAGIDMVMSGCRFAEAGWLWFWGCMMIGSVRFEVGCTAGEEDGSAFAP